jgi:hypothetical protein
MVLNDKVRMPGDKILSLPDAARLKGPNMVPSRSKDGQDQASASHG